MDPGGIGKVPKTYPKSVQNRHKKKGIFFKTANIDSKYDLFIHSTIKFDSKQYSMAISSGISNWKDYSILFFPEISIKKLIKKFEFGCIQFNKMFIKLENPGIAHPYQIMKYCIHSCSYVVGMFFYLSLIRGRRVAFCDQHN